MNNKLAIAVVISAAVHAAAMITSIYLSRPVDVPFGDGIIALELTLSIAPKKGVGRLLGGPTIKAAENIESAQYSKVAEGSNDGSKSGPETVGSKIGLGAGSIYGNPILTKIRTKIERSKYYPPEAKKDKITGKSVVSFKIKEDGSVENVLIKESSGTDILDKAAFETLKRAEPLPYFAEALTIAIKFEMR